MLQIACHVPRPTAPGQIDRSSHFFHSDCSVQHASTVYTDLLKANGIAISMSRSGNPYDNALKYERCTAANTGTWRRRAPRSARVIEKDCNQKRLHDDADTLYASGDIGNDRPASNSHFHLAIVGKSP
jgi:hypothetical protein